MNKLARAKYREAALNRRLRKHIGRRIYKVRQRRPWGYLPVGTTFDLMVWWPDGKQRQCTYRIIGYVIALVDKRAPEYECESLTIPGKIQLNRETIAALGLNIHVPPRSYPLRDTDDET